MTREQNTTVGCPLTTTGQWDVPLSPEDLRLVRRYLRRVPENGKISVAMARGLMATLDALRQGEGI